LKKRIAETEGPRGPTMRILMGYRYGSLTELVPMTMLNFRFDQDLATRTADHQRLADRLAPLRFSDHCLDRQIAGRAPQQGWAAPVDRNSAARLVSPQPAEWPLQAAPRP
jgi:hypothetical protein